MNLLFFLQKGECVCVCVRIAILTIFASVY